MQSAVVNLRPNSLILERQIPLLRAHLIPHDLHVPLQARVARIFVQRAGEPVIGKRQVAVGAMACGVHSRESALRFGVVVIRRRGQILLGAGAIRCDSAGAVQIFLTFKKHAVLGWIRAAGHYRRGFR